MTAQSVAGLPLGGPAAGERRIAVKPPPRRVLVLAALAGLGAALVSLAAFVLILPRIAAPDRTGGAIGEGAPWPSPFPLVRNAELWYATTAAPGVWAELKVVVDNPLAAGQTNPTRSTLLISGTVLEDFRIRSTEPKLLTQPQRRPDGRYAFTFPAPIPESLNWYRVYLECRKASPRPLSLTFMWDGARDLPELAPSAAQVFFTDRQADPFKVIPEPLVRWVPGQSTSAFPVLVLYALAVGVVAAAGCVAAFRAVRR
jgi:hypothetical protein